MIDDVYYKKLFKGPISLSCYILMSVIVFMQFIALFLGRWFDIVEFSSTVLVVVLMWMLFASNFSKGVRTVKKKTMPLAFAWVIVKLVSVSMSILFILISGVYMIARAGYDYAGLTVAGLLLLVLVGGIYVYRLIINIMALMEINSHIKDKNTLFIPEKKWFIFCIVLASLRGLSLILQCVISALAHKYLLIIGWEDYTYGLFDGFSGNKLGGSFFARIICRSLNIGSDVCVTIIDMCYIAFFVLVAILIRRYIVEYNKKDKIYS